VKIYTKVKFDMNSLEVLEEDSFEWSGPVALCGGGGSTTTINSYDPTYNAGMLQISKEQQAMAQEYFNFWRDTYKDYETKQVESNTRMMPYMEEAEIAEAKLNKQKFETGQDLMGRQAQVARAAYDEALKGVDGNRAASQAQADVVQSFDTSKESLNRDMARLGLSTSDPGYASAMVGLARDKAKATAGAMTTARNTASDKSFSRLSTAAGLGI